MKTERKGRRKEVEAEVGKTEESKANSYLLTITRE